MNKPMQIITYYAASYAMIPAITYAGATIGARVGGAIASSAWDKIANCARGVIKPTLSTKKIYIVSRGEVIEIDPRKKYIIVRGEVVIEDLAAAEQEWELL